MTHMMKAEFKGKCDVPQYLRFWQPKAIDGPVSKVKDLYMTSEEDVKHVESSLAKLNRVPVKVCTNMNIINMYT